MTYDVVVGGNDIAVCAFTFDTKYPVIGEPPLYGAVQLNVTCTFPGNALKLMGALGTVDGVALA
jgi:hypothetical protein